MNVMLSLQAAYTAPIIMMSQNRQGVIDRAEAHLDYETNRTTSRGVHLILERLDQNAQEIEKLRAAGRVRAYLREAAQPKPKPRKEKLYQEMLEERAKRDAERVRIAKQTREQERKAAQKRAAKKRRVRSLDELDKLRRRRERYHERKEQERQEILRSQAHNQVVQELIVGLDQLDQAARLARRRERDRARRTEKKAGDAKKSTKKAKTEETKDFSRFDLIE
jgi:hypothetical protein